MTEPSKTPRTDALTSWDWIQGEHAMTQLEGHYQRLKDLAGELEVSLSETQSARGRLAHEVDQWRAFGQSLTGVDANDCGWLRAEMESQWRKKEDYAELNLRWRRYGERLQLAMLELEERTRPDGDMADAPVNALVKNALLDAFDAYQPGSESEIDSKTPTGGAHGEQAKMEVPGDAAGPATGRDEPDDGLAADDGVAGRDGRGGVGVRGLRPSVVAREGNAAGLVDLPQASVVPGPAVGKLRAVGYVERWTELGEEAGEPQDIAYVFDSEDREICTIFRDGSLAIAERIADALNRESSQYSLPPGAWVEHGAGWVKVHALSSPEAVAALCSFLAKATP